MSLATRLPRPLVVPLTNEGFLHPDVWADLAGQVRPCFELVREVLGRLGVKVVGLSVEASDVWQPVDGEPAPGDVALAVADGQQHVGICLGGGKVLHATSITRRVAVGSLGSWSRSGALRAVLRHAGTVPAEPVPEAAGGSVRVVHIADLVRDPARRDHAIFGAAAGLTLKAVAPRGANVVLTAGGPRRIDEEPDRPLVPGETVVFATAPSGTELLISLAVGLALSGLSLLLAPAIPAPSGAREESSPGYDLSGLRNTSRVGIPEPLVYGEMTVGGNLITAYQRVGEDGRSTLYALQFVSIGPIQSIAGLTEDADELQGPDIPDGLKIDGNAASSYDCAVSIRLGGSNQLPIPGFYETVNEFPQTPTLQEETPFHYETTQQVDGFHVQITFPTGLVDVTSSGAFASRRVVFTVRWRPVGSSTWSTYTWTVVDARQTAFSRQFEKLGLTRDRYEIQVERADGDGIISAPWPESAPKFYSQSVLSAVREIVAGARSHPGKALVGWRIRQTEQLGTAIPRLTAAIEGRKVFVWDGVSTATPNMGSSEVYTRTPAWCIFDLLVNSRYGGGRSGRLGIDNVDLEDIYDFAEANDYAVSDGRGGTAPRAVLNILIDTQRPLWEIVLEIAGAAWGRLYQAGNKVRVILDAFGAAGPPTVPEFVFGLGNARDIRFSHYGRVRRPNLVEAGYFNEEANYEADTYPAEDDASIVDRAEPVVSETFQVPGCTRPYQAARMATYRRNFHRDVDRGVSLVSGPESLALLPGAVVSVHGAGVHDGYSGRLLGATSNSVTLDRDVVVSAPTRVRVWLKAQTTDAITTTAYIPAGTYARGSPITVVASGGGATTISASAGDVWSIEDPTGSGRARLFRVAKIRTDRDGTRYFDAHKYDVGMFDDNPGEVPEFTDELPNVKAIPAAPSVTARSLEYASCDGGVVDGILVEFQCPERWQYGEVWYRALGGAQDDGAVAWRFAGWARGAYQIAPLAGCTNYEVAVVGVAPGGARQRIEHASRAMVFLRGRRDPPLAPTSLKAEVVAGMLHVTIGRPADATIAGFEVVYGDHFAGSVRLALRAGDELLVPCPFVGTQTIRAKSVSRTGFHSLDEVTASVTAQVAESIYTRDVNSNSHTGWAGTKTNTAVTSSELQLSGSNLSGTYQTPDYATAITKEVQELRITLKGDLARTAATWDESVHRWVDSSWTWSTWCLRGDEIEAAQRLPTWDHWGFSWDSMIASLLTWEGGVDVFAALTPTIEYDADTGSGFSGSWTQYTGPVTIANLAGVRVRVTMRRPHSRYDPRLVELNVSTLALAASEPPPLAHAFWNNTATAVSARTVGIGNTTGTDAALVVPSGKKLKILQAHATVKSGATVGSYKGLIVLRNVTDASDTTLFEVTGAENTNMRGAASGTRASPVAELAAGKTWMLGWFNQATSVGAFANVFHQVHVSYVLEDV